MTTPHQVRRATVEDIAQLSPMWEQENLPTAELEKRFKEFQVVEQEGILLGAIGFQVLGQEGLLHSEVFLRPEDAEFVREHLWERAQILAKNHGLIRVWTQLHTPFWHGNGFKAPTGEIAAKLPGVFAYGTEPWLYVQLREETAALPSIDKEFALFKESEREQTERMLRQAKVLKVIAAGIAVIVFLLVIVWAIYFFRLQRKMGNRPMAEAPAPQAVCVVKEVRAIAENSSA